MRQASLNNPGTAKVFRAAALALMLGAMPASVAAADDSAAASASTAAAEPEADFRLTIRQTDTLIGIGRRLLIDPGRWPELQQHNNIKDPLRLVPGSVMVIPRAMLRVDPSEVVVREVVGPATRADGTPLAQNDKLPEGAGVKTADNGYVTLQLIDGSTLRLQPRSELKVERTRRVPGSQVTETQIQLPAGQAEVKFTPAAPKTSRFQIRTGFASAAVRGTEFRVSASEKGTRSEVTEGTIEFAGIPAGGGQTAPADAVAVKEGFGSFVDDSRKPVPPVQLLPAPALPRPQVMQLAPNFRYRLPPIAGAVRYRVTVARDMNMQQVIREAYFERSDINLPDIAPGSYVIQVRAIDKFGLEGRDARVPLTMIAGKPAAPAP